MEVIATSEGAVIVKWMIAASAVVSVGILVVGLVARIRQENKNRTIRETADRMAEVTASAYAGAIETENAEQVPEIIKAYATLVEQIAKLSPSVASWVVSVIPIAIAAGVVMTYLLS